MTTDPITRIRRVLEGWGLVRDGGIGQLAEAIAESLSAKPLDGDAVERVAAAIYPELAKLDYWTADEACAWHARKYAALALSAMPKPAPELPFEVSAFYEPSSERIVIAWFSHAEKASAAATYLEDKHGLKFVQVTDLRAGASAMPKDGGTTACPDCDPVEGFPANCRTCQGSGFVPKNGRALEPKSRPDVHGLWLMVRGAEPPRAFVLPIISGVGEEGDRWYGPIVLRHGAPELLGGEVAR